jgi:HAD superfamily hydrolase (TIGR01509 family)
MLPGLPTPDLAAVLFDLDGVLVLSAPAHHAAYEALLAAVGVPFSMADFERICLGKPRELVLRQLFPDASAERLAWLMNEKVRLTRRFIQERGLGPVPGALAFVRALRAAGLPTAVVTASRTPELLLDAIGARQLFDTVVCGADVSRPKPAPDGYLLAAQRLGVFIGRCLVVEDSPIGVQAGRTAGARVLAITTTETAAALGEADRVVGGFHELEPGTPLR